MKLVKIISTIAPGHVIEVVRAISLALERLNYNVEIDFIEELDSVVYSDFCNIILRVRRNWIAPEDLPKTSIKILYQTEQQWVARERKTFPESGWDLVLDLFKENVEKAPSNVKYCPAGYSEAFDVRYNTIVKKNLNLYFFGAMTPDRGEWRRYLTKYKRMRCNGKDFYENKEENIIASKINLFLKATELYLYPALHCLQVQCKEKILMVQECDGFSGPFRSGFHFISFKDKVDFDEKYRFLIKNQTYREEFASKALLDLKLNHSFEKYFNIATKGYLV